MANHKKDKRESDNRASPSLWIFIGLAVAIGIGYAIYRTRTTPASPDPTPSVTMTMAASSPLQSNAQTAVSTTNAEPPTMDINKAVMVTVELDFGPRVPPIAEALQQIDRHYEPADGVGRTFAILDAYGEPTADGKKLHMSMHVSTEKPGVGSLSFRRTGEVLWKSKIVATNSQPASQKNLLILFQDADGRSYTVDGSRNPSSILDATLKESGADLRTVWPDGAEREFTYIYSACGCPVKAMVRRVGDRTERAKELPVMFPDDPAALNLISHLMRW